MVEVQKAEVLFYFLYCLLYPLNKIMQTFLDCFQKSRWEMGKGLKGTTFYYMM